jgi:branched-chain amino acid transport system substrate-binding protein
MKKSTLLRVSAIAVSLAFVTAACGSDSESSTTEDTVVNEVTDDTAAAAVDGVTCEPVSIAFFGALSGDAGNLGKNIRNGADLAVSEFNTANPDCQVGLVDFDSQGDPAQAPALADKAIADASILGIVGPAFSGESKAANPKFDAAGLALITPSATNATLNDNNWKVFHRALAGDQVQGAGIAA